MRSLLTGAGSWRSSKPSRLHNDHVCVPHEMFGAKSSLRNCDGRSSPERREEPKVVAPAVHRPRRRSDPHPTDRIFANALADAPVIANLPGTRRARQDLAAPEGSLDAPKRSRTIA